MTSSHSPSPNIRASKGVTLFELLIGLAVSTMVTAAVFSGMSSVMLFSSQDEIVQRLRDDLYITMNYIRRDCRLATNVVAKAGGRFTDGTTLVLRQPRLGLDNEIVDDEFQWVTYTVEDAGPNSDGGLIRELWHDPEAAEPVERKVLNTSIVTLGFLYGGKSVANVSNLVLVRDVEMILISARETKLKRGAGTTDVSEFLNVEDLEYLAESGVDFTYLRAFIDYMNATKVDVVIASSMGAATVRNQRALGLKTPEPPGGA